MSTFNDLLAAHLEGLPNGFVAAIEAERFRDLLRSEHPEVLEAWLTEQELRAIHRAMIDYERANRTRVRNRAISRTFADGDVDELSAFDIRFVVDEENLRKRVADMTGVDHAFVAAGYEASAKQDLMLAEFHRAIAKKVGKRRTADVLDVEQFAPRQRRSCPDDPRRAHDYPSASHLGPFPSDYPSPAAATRPYL